MQLVHISHGDRTSIVSVYFAIVPQARNIYATQSADCICPIYQPHITTQSIIERQCDTVHRTPRTVEHSEYHINGSIDYQV